MARGGKWVLWVRWILAMALMTALAWLAGKFRDLPLVHWGLVGLVVAVPCFYKPIKQRIELAIDGQPVLVTFEMNLLGRVRWRWQSDVASNTEILGRFWGVPLWFEKEILVGSSTRRILVYAKPYPNGFLVGKGNQDYSFAVVRDAFSF